LLPFEFSKEIWQWDLNPGVVFYVAPISACQKGAEWLPPFNFLQEMWQWDLILGVISYVGATSAFENGGE